MSIPSNFYPRLPQVNWNDAPRMDVLNDVQPFTRRDTFTWEGKIEQLITWVRETSKLLESNGDKLNTAWIAQAEFLIAEFSRISNELIESVVDSSIDLQDPVLASIANNVESLSRGVLDGLYAPQAIVATFNALNEAYTEITETGRLSQASLDYDYLARDVATNGRLSYGRLKTYNVSDFGAVADGMALTHTNIQAAIDAAHTDGGGTVLLNDGTYMIGSHVIVKGGVRLVGVPGKTRIRRALGAVSMIRNWENGDTTTGGYNGHSDIELSGIIFDANSTVVTAEANVVAFNHSSKIYVHDCVFESTMGFHALEINGTRDVVVERNRFLGYTAGTQTFKEAIQIDSANPGDSGLADGTMAKNVTIRDNYFGPLGGLPAHDIAVGGHARNPDSFYEAIHIVNNVIEGVKNYGIRAYYFKDSTIIGNVVRSESNTLHGIRLEGALSTTAESNTVIGSLVATSSFGLNVTMGCKDCTVASNYIENFNQGLYCGTSTAPSERTIIANNTIRKSKTRAIVNDGGTDTLIQGNLIDGAGYVAGGDGAIRLSGGGMRPSIVGNKVRPHGAGVEISYAVSIVGALDVWVFGNDFLGIPAAIQGAANTTSNRITT